MPALGGPASTVCHSSSVNAAFPVIERRTLHAAHSPLCGASGSRLCEMVCPSCGTENLEAKKFCKECGAALAPATNCGSCGRCSRRGREVLRRVRCARSRPSIGPAPRSPPHERLPRPSAGSSPCCSPTWSASRASRSRAIPRKFASCSRATSTLPAADRALRRHGGEVHRRRGHGRGVRRGDRGRRGARGPRGARSRRGRVGDGQEVGAEDLRARAGVLTGEAAVTTGAQVRGHGRGRSRQHCLARAVGRRAGRVYVGESTRRATEQAVVYEEAGSFELKGKAGLTPLWKAAGSSPACGSRSSRRPRGAVRRPRPRAAPDQGAFPLLCGRAYGAARSVASPGSASHASRGSSTSTSTASPLSVYWHRGRCLAYGEGVTYWALADMVRRRCRIAEDEPADSALEKLRAGSRSTSPTRRSVASSSRGSSPARPRRARVARPAGPVRRLAVVLRAARRRLSHRARLRGHAVGRRLAAGLRRVPAGLVAQLAAVRDHVRPARAARAAAELGAGHRNFASLYLDPLPQEAMEELLTVSCRGSRRRAGADPRPRGRRAAVRHGDRADADRPRRPRPAGIRLPAVRHDRRARGAGDPPCADRRPPRRPRARRAPPPPGRRGLGKTFTRAGLAALTGLSGGASTRSSQSLVRKEVISLQSDLRSPEYGQYGFLQDCPPRRLRDALQARAAGPPPRSSRAPVRGAVRGRGPPEVVASHLVEAYRLDPAAEGAAGARGAGAARARGSGRAGESLAAAAEARRYFEAAAELADQPLQQGRSAPAGRASWPATAATPSGARTLLEEAIETYEAEGDTHAAARASGRLGRVPRVHGSPGRGGREARAGVRGHLRRTSPTRISPCSPRSSRARYWFSGDLERGRCAGRARARHRRGAAASGGARVRAPGEGRRARSAGGTARRRFALTKHALELCARARPHATQASTIYFILSDGCFRGDRYAEALTYLDESLALARKVGSRPYEWAALAERTYPLLMLGRWDEVLATADEFTQEQVDAGGVVLSVLESGVEVHVQRGELDEARRIHAMFARLEQLVRPAGPLHLALGDSRAPARRGTLRGGDLRGDGHGSMLRESSGTTFQSVKHGVVDAVEAALALGKTGKAEELLDFVDGLPSGGRPPFLEAQARRLRAWMAKDAGGPRGRGTAVPRPRRSVPARGRAARARGADGKRGLARRGARDLRAARGEALARTCRGRSSAAGAGIRLDD